MFDKPMFASNVWGQSDATQPQHEELLHKVPKSTVIIMWYDTHSAPVFQLPSQNTHLTSQRRRMRKRLMKRRTVTMMWPLRQWGRSKMTLLPLRSKSASMTIMMTRMTTTKSPALLPNKSPRKTEINAAAILWDIILCSQTFHYVTIYSCLECSGLIRDLCYIPLSPPCPVISKLLAINTT